MLARRLKQYALLKRVRKRREDLKAAALAAARRDVRNAQHDRDQIEAYQRKIVEQAMDAAQGELRPHRANEYIHYERHLAQLAVKKDAEIATMELTADERLAELSEAAQERRIADKLNEKLGQRKLREQAKAEQRIYDELGAVRSAIDAKRARGK